MYMNDIIISGEKFYLKNLKYIRGVCQIEINREVKRVLRYQKLFLIRETDYEVVDLSGLFTINVSPDYDEAYVIVRTKEPTLKEVRYDEDDIRIIKCIIHYFSGIKPEITEKLCKAIGYNILSEYHCSFGISMLSKFRSTLFDKNPIKIGRPDILYYGRPKYSLLDLMKDFSKTPDLQIFLDPELIGKYKRISRRVEDGSKVLKDRWAKFIGVAGNRTRANISLKTLSKVKVMVPENDKGVEPGEKILTSLRSFTLVVDGKLNMEEIGIKTSRTDLIGKLKRLGIVEPMLFEGEYVINLTQLPLFRKLPSISSYQLGYAEFKVKESDIMLKFINLLIYRQEKELKELPRKIKEPEQEKSESELFLESLGIFGDVYYPGKTKTVTSEKFYMATEIEGKVKGIPENLYPNLRDYINTGSCKNAVIMKALIGLAGLREEIDLKKLTEIRKGVEKEKKIRADRLKSLKYRVISGKTLTFTDQQLEKARVKVGAAEVTWNVRETKVVI